MKRPADIEDSVHVRLFEAAFTEIGMAWATRNVQSAFWRFYANNRDGASLELADRSYPLEAGRLYFVPAGVRFTCRNRARVGHFYIHFDLLGVTGMAMRELFSEPILLPEDASLERQAHEWASECASKRDDAALPCGLKALVYTGLALHLTRLPADARERLSHRTASRAPVLPALEAIEADPGAPLPVRHLAELCSMSEDYFHRRFRQCIGQPPSRYLRERRLTLAAQRLLFTSASIERIAEEAGFGTRFSFTRVFTREMGLSPAAYRKGYHRPDGA